MKYKPRQYAESLYEAIHGKEGTKREAALKRFVNILRRNGDYKFLGTILARYESVFLEKRGMKKVEIESAAKLSSDVRKEIESAVGAEVLLEEKINPELLAGLTVLVNDSILIDASGRTRVKKLFA